MVIMARMRKIAMAAMMKIATRKSERDDVKREARKFQ